ncbi:MAG: hypothetical protein ACLRMZ_11530 [Blautia marasmi]
MLESVRLVTEIIGQITASSIEQADSILQIEQGIERISEVVQTTLLRRKKARLPVKSCQHRHSF